MLMEKNVYNNLLKNSSTDLIQNCKYQIGLLSYYLLLTFDSIHSSLGQCEKMLIEISKKKKRNKIK